MSCNSNTPWSATNHPYTVNRLRVTTGGSTNQSTGEWKPESTSSTAICGYLGRGTSGGTGGLHEEDLISLAGGQFKVGDQYFVCHSDCDVALNDIIEVYEDATGTTKTYWRVITKLKELSVFKTLRGYGMNFWLVRREER